MCTSLVVWTSFSATPYTPHPSTPKYPPPRGVTKRPSALSPECHRPSPSAAHASSVNFPAGTPSDGCVCDYMYRSSVAAPAAQRSAAAPWRGWSDSIQEGAAQPCCRPLGLCTGGENICIMCTSIATAGLASNTCSPHLHFGLHKAVPHRLAAPKCRHPR